MGKLATMVAEPVSLPERLKISAKRMRLAGIGLVSKVDHERTRLYRQVMELGESYGGEDTLAGKLTRISTGTVHYVLEESQRVFDELVETGEKVLAGERPKVGASKISTPRTVAKTAIPKRPVLEAETRTAAPVRAGAVKPAKTSAQGKAKAKVAAKKQPESTATDLRQAFDDAKARLRTLTSPPDRNTVETLYALYKQATEGDVSGRRPGATRMIERAKYDARQAVKGMSASDAMERYVATANSLFSA